MQDLVFRTAAERRLADSVVHALVSNAITAGEIDPRGKSDEELEADAIKFLRRCSRSETRFLLYKDHTGAVLESARAYAQSGQFELSCLMYAT